MAQVLALGDVLRVRVACYTANQVGINTVHYRVSTVGGSSQTDAQVALYMDTLLETRYKTVLSAQAKYRGVSVQKIRPLPVTVPQVSTAFDGVGSVAGDMLATQVSGIVTSQTALAGPANRGRAYIPFPGESDNGVSAAPVPAYVTGIDDIGSELFTPHPVGLAPNQITITPVIYHRATATFTDIVGWVARSQWATQRRRGAYGKFNSVPF